jgi:hypothetical protein
LLSILRNWSKFALKILEKILKEGSMKKIVGVVLCLVLLSYYPVLADSVSEVDLPSFEVTKIITFETTGNMMGGMAVTAFFLGGSSETKPWVNGGGVSGGVTGTGWSLSESGTTFTNNWTLDTGANTITKLTFDGFPGNTVFDRTFGGADGTPGSSSGADFNRTSINQDLEVDATYLNLVFVGANAPVGDLFRNLELVFNDGDGFSGAMTYIADTDNVELPPTIPEPATMLLLGSGLIGLAGFARRRFKK